MSEKNFYKLKNLLMDVSESDFESFLHELSQYGKRIQKLEKEVSALKAELNALKSNQQKAQKTPDKVSVSVPKSDDVSLFSYSNVSDGIRIDSFNGFNQRKVAVPERINGKPVVEIGDDAFRNCNFIKVVHLPETLKRIGHKAFFDDTQYTESSYLDCIYIPKSVVDIGHDVFSGRFSGRKIKSTIYCHPGSYAMQYARKNNIPVRPAQEFKFN